MRPIVGYQGIWNIMLAELHFPELDDGCRRDRSDRAYLNIIGVIINKAYVVGWTGLPPVDSMVYRESCGFASVDEGCWLGIQRTPGT